jgi:hypothetical protein
MFENGNRPQHGLMVEAGTVRDDGCAISALRSETKAISKVA